jgi:putative membrane protein
MTYFKLAIPAALATLALPALAQMPTPTPTQFVAKAGASDVFELREAKLMMSSSSAGIRDFAQQMQTDHTKSTALVKAAAMKDGLKPGAPMLSAKQTHDIAALTAAKGKARDTLYVTQQKAAHADALALMQGYSMSGTATHLKATAGEIAPVVQGHIDMLGKMSM